MQPSSQFLMSSYYLTYLDLELTTTLDHPKFSITEKTVYNKKLNYF